jgi:hypothetical protein
MPAALRWREDHWKVTLCTKTGLREVRCQMLVDCSGDANIVSLGAMLPQGSQQLIVAGRCICGDPQAHSSYRVQATAMATGQAAGAAAALATQLGCDVSEVPLPELRALLRAHGAIVPG